MKARLIEPCWRGSRWIPTSRRECRGRFRRCTVGDDLHRGRHGSSKSCASSMIRDRKSRVMREDSISVSVFKVKGKNGWKQLCCGEKRGDGDAPVLGHIFPMCVDVLCEPLESKLLAPVCPRRLIQYLVKINARANRTGHDSVHAQGVPGTGPRMPPPAKPCDGHVDTRTRLAVSDSR